ncbi:phosphoheptose isomerase [archaeon]|nr:phosphoheptose isomerase [archaeon]
MDETNNSIILKDTFMTDGKTASPLLTEDTKNLIIDIDGVICEDIPNEEPERMPGAYEIPRAKDIINAWYDKGHIITFFTARTEETRKVTETWLKKHGFKYHEVLFNKPRGGHYHYIDNAPIDSTRFEGCFDELLERTKNFPIKNK